MFDDSLNRTLRQECVRPLSGMLALLLLLISFWSGGTVLSCDDVYGKEIVHAAVFDFDEAIFLPHSEVVEAVHSDIYGFRFGGGDITFIIRSQMLATHLIGYIKIVQFLVISPSLFQQLFPFHYYW